jgi:phage baseplate assembly protein W
MAKGDYLGCDLDLGFIVDEEARVLAGPYSQVDLQAVVRTDVSPRTRDLHLAGGLANLVQSLIVRLRTERGELAGLAHPDYGSRHHRLIGEQNTEGNRNLIKLYVLECLRQEPRLEAIRRVDVKPGQGRENRDKVEISITAVVRGVPDPLSFVVPFSFEGEGA